MKEGFENSFKSIFHKEVCLCFIRNWKPTNEPTKFYISVFTTNFRELKKCARMFSPFWVHPKILTFVTPLLRELVLLEVLMPRTGYKTINRGMIMYCEEWEGTTRQQFIIPANANVEVKGKGDAKDNVS